MLRRSVFAAMILILVCAFSAAALEFTPVTIDEGTDEGYMPSMVMDLEGNPHIVSLGDGGKTLKYSHFDGTDWQVQTVDTCERAESFYFPSIALDEDGGIHISYYIGDNRNDLLYAYFDGQNWIKETVDTNGDAGIYSSIAIDIDSEGDPCIGYGVEDTFEIRFASRKDGAWNVEMVTSDDSFLYYPSMVLDSLDRPHFLYISQEEDAFHLNYLIYEGEGSVPRQVDREEVWGSMPSLVLDQNDHPHIIYLERESGSMEYAFVSGDQLAYIPVTDDDARIESTRSIVIDDESKIHVCYLVRSSNGFPNTRYAVLENGSWASADIGSQGYDEFPSIALTPEGEPAVCYMDGINRDLRFSYPEADEWKKTTVPPSGARTGYFPLMRLDQADNPHILYCDYYGQHINYASYDGKSWNIMRTELSDSFMDDPAFGFSEEGVPYAAFTEINLESREYSLKVGVLSGDEWAQEEITPFGRYPSLEVGRNGNPGVCFTSLDGFSDSGLEGSASLQEELYYASKIDGSWKIDQVTPEDISVDDKNVFCLDLANDPDNVPSICYVEVSSMVEGTKEYKFRYAVSTDQGWQMETISSDIGVKDALMVFDNSQVLHMAFVAIPLENNMSVAEAKETEVITTSEPSVNTLYYASRVGGEWIIQKVEDLGEDLSLGQLSMVFDEDNNPHITYPHGNADLSYAEEDEVADKQYRSLKYAYYDGENWHTALLAQGLMESYGSQSSLALDSTGTPHVAYFTGNSLNYGKVRPSSSGGGCSLGIIAPAAVLLLLPLFLLKKY
jgi:Synergist-CTERM protein sorting domain-containing protein